MYTDKPRKLTKMLPVETIHFFQLPGQQTEFPAVEDSLETDRLKYMNEVLASIKGKEKMEADSVFKNLQVIKGKVQFLLSIFCG